jgi:hypothetical protein
VPQTGMICPDPFMWDVSDGGDFLKEVPTADCLDCSLTRTDRGCSWDYADIKARVDRPASYCSFTPSKMNGCDMELYLRINFNYATNPAEVGRMVAGSAAHLGLEVIHPDIIGETTVVRLLDMGEGWHVPITVKPDKVYIGQQLIHDDKTRAYMAQEDLKPKPIDSSEDLVRQLSVGAWAWGQPAFASKDGVVWHPEPLNISLGQVTYRQSDGTKQLRTLVPLLDFQELERWMRGRVMDLVGVYDGNEPDAEENWRCKNCQVRQLCPVGSKLKQPRRRSK